MRVKGRNAKIRRFVEVSGYSLEIVYKICREFRLNYRELDEKQMREAADKWSKRPRKTPKNITRVSVGDRSLTLREWAAACDISFETLQSRVWLRKSAQLAVEESLQRPGMWPRGHVRSDQDGRVKRYTIAGVRVSAEEIAETCGVSEDHARSVLRRLGKTKGISSLLAKTGKAKEIRARFESLQQHTARKGQAVMSKKSQAKKEQKLGSAADGGLISERDAARSSKNSVDEPTPSVDPPRCEESVSGAQS